MSLSVRSSGDAAARSAEEYAGNVRAVFLGFALLHGGEDTAIIRKRAQFRAIRLSRSLE